MAGKRSTHSDQSAYTCDRCGCLPCCCDETRSRRISDPRLSSRSPNIVAAPCVETRLADEWAQSEIEGRIMPLGRAAAMRSVCGEAAWPYCGVA